MRWRRLGIVGGAGCAGRARCRKPAVSGAHRRRRAAGARRHARRAAAQPIRVHPAAVLHGDARRAGGAVHNPCYACHLHPRGAELRRRQRSAAVVHACRGARRRTPGATCSRRRWRARRARPTSRCWRTSAQSNYFDAAGEHRRWRAAWRALPAAWDGEGDHRWDGYVPDACFHFDDRGFDRTPDGSATGWRAFAYTPFLGGRSCRPTARWTTC